MIYYDWMTESQEPVKPKVPSPPSWAEEDVVDNADSISPVDHTIKGAQDYVSDVTEIILDQTNNALHQLSDWREAEGNSPYDFDLNFIYQLYRAGRPLTRTDMLHQTGNQALVITLENYLVLQKCCCGFLYYIDASGERKLIKLGFKNPDDVFILYPDEVGNEETEEVDI